MLNPRRIQGSRQPIRKKRKYLPRKMGWCPAAARYPANRQKIRFRLSATVFFKYAIYSVISSLIGFSLLNEHFRKLFNPFLFVWRFSQKIALFSLLPNFFSLFTQIHTVPTTICLLFNNPCPFTTMVIYGKHQQHFPFFPLFLLSCSLKDSFYL